MKYFSEKALEKKIEAIGGGGKTYTAGNGLALDGNTFSIDQETYSSIEHGENVYNRINDWFEEVNLGTEQNPAWALRLKKHGDLLRAFVSYGDQIVIDGEPGGGGGGGASYLYELLDVTINNPTNEQALIYQNGKWINQNVVTDLSNYYTKVQVDNLIGAIDQFRYEIYPSLPYSGEGNVLYLIGPTGTGNDKYDEYVYANSSWTKIGDTSIDLSGYVQKSSVKTLTLQLNESILGTFNPLGDTDKTINITKSSLSSLLSDTFHPYGGSQILNTFKIGGATLTWHPESAVGAGDAYLELDSAFVTHGDQIVINGTPGGGGGGVDHLYLLDDVYGNFTTGRVKTADGADVSDGQALVWNTSLGKWVAGTAGGGSTYSAGTAIKIANDTISVSGTLDTDPISFDPDTHSGVDPSNPVAWGSASGPYGIKLSVNSVVKDLVLVSGYNALAARVTALEDAPEGGITRIGTYQGAVTLGANLSITENGVLSATDTTYGAATTSAAGLMSAADKAKLNGIAEGATAVSDATVSSWGYAKTSALPGYASDTTAGIIKIGTGLTISDSGVVSVTGQTQGTVTRVDVGGAQYGPSASGVVSLPAYPTTLPASDVYSWAKAASKPSYSLSEISGLQNALDGKQPLDADLTAIAGLAGTSGFLKKISANEWALDTNTYLTAHQTIYQLVINNYAGTAQITYQPATSGNYSLTLTKAMVGLSNVPNWVYIIQDSSTQTFVA